MAVQAATGSRGSTELLRGHAKVAAVVGVGDKLGVPEPLCAPDHEPDAPCIWLGSTHAATMLVVE